MSEQALGVQAFAALLRAHAASTRELNALLVADHGLTISDYEVLLRLRSAPQRQMRRVDLAGQVLLSPSGITRLLDGLERDGLVARGACREDRRVVYAVLTDAGLGKLRQAAETHLAQVHAYFSARLDDDELAALATLLTRASAGATAECDSDA